MFVSEEVIWLKHRVESLERKVASLEGDVVELVLLKKRGNWFKYSFALPVAGWGFVILLLYEALFRPIISGFDFPVSFPSVPFDLLFGLLILTLLLDSRRIGLFSLALGFLVKVLSPAFGMWPTIVRRGSRRTNEHGGDSSSIPIDLCTYDESNDDGFCASERGMLEVAEAGSVGKEDD